MKKLFFIVTLLFVSLSVNLKPKLEIAPRTSLYLGEGNLFYGTNLGLGADVVFNPTNNVGIRFNVIEAISGNNAVFLLNSRLLNSVDSRLYNSGSILDLLFYMTIGGLKSYINAGLGIHTHHGRTYFALETGIGLQHYMGGGKTLFLEPNLVIGYVGYSDYGYNTDFAFRLSAGLRFPVIK